MKILRQTHLHRSVRVSNKMRIYNYLSLQIEEGNEGGDDNMEEVMGNPPDKEANEEIPGAVEEEAVVDDDMM